MCFRATLLIVALVALVQPNKFPEKKCRIQLAFVCMKPNCRETNPPVIMLHGLSGTKETWNGIFERIPSITRRRVCIYDARNHGKSFWSDTFTVDVLAEDLKCLMDHLNIRRAALVGHSLGGLTVMRFALKYGSKVERLFVEDIGPKVPEPTFAVIALGVKLLAASLQTVPENANETTAKEAIANFIRQVVPDIDPETVFAAQPLVFRDGAWQFRTNVKALSKALEDVNGTLGVNEGRYYGNTLFVYGKDSDFKVGGQKEDIKKLFPFVKFIEVDTAVHGLHSVYPEEYLRNLTRFLEYRFCKRNLRSVGIDSDVNHD